MDENEIYRLRNENENQKISTTVPETTSSHTDAPVTPPPADQSDLTAAEKAVIVATVTEVENQNDPAKKTADKRELTLEKLAEIEKEIDSGKAKPSSIPIKAALARLRPRLRKWINEGYNDLQIAVKLSELCGFEITQRDVKLAVRKPRRKPRKKSPDSTANNAAEQTAETETMDQQTPAVSAENPSGAPQLAAAESESNSAPKSAENTSPAAVNQQQSTAEVAEIPVAETVKQDIPAVDEKPALSPLIIDKESVLKWHEQDGKVILKDGITLPTKTLIKLPSGRIGEVVICRPTTYSSGFRNRVNAIEVQFKVAM